MWKSVNKRWIPTWKPESAKTSLHQPPSPFRNSLTQLPMFEEFAEVPQWQPTVQHISNNLGASCMLCLHSTYKCFENLPAFQRCMNSVIKRIDRTEITVELFHIPTNPNTIKPPRHAWQRVYKALGSSSVNVVATTLKSFTHGKLLCRHCSAFYSNQLS